MAALAALWARYRTLRHAFRIGLITPPAYRNFNLAILASGGVMAIGVLTVFYETLLWPPFAACIFLIVIALLLRIAGRGMQTGLQGLKWPVPSDGMAILEREQARRSGTPWSWRLRLVGPGAACCAVVLLAASSQPQRWLVWLAVGVLFTLPALLVAYRQSWIAPLLLLLATGFLGWRSLNLRNQVPPGQWSTLWTAARCTSQVAITGSNSAWCLNPNQETVYHFDPASGQVQELYVVAAANAVLAANSRAAWITTDGNGNTVHFLQSGRNRQRTLNRPIRAALAEDGTLWQIDVAGRLFYLAGSDQREVRLDTSAGLLSNLATNVRVLADGSTWIGSHIGVSRRAAGETHWTTYGHETGLRGAVIDIALAPNGSYWFLQRRGNSGFLRSSRFWWLSALHTDGSWQHFDMNVLTTLRRPLPERNAMAIDGLGRIWLTAIAVRPSEKFLVVVQADGTIDHNQSLGLLQQIGTGSNTDELFGVVSDGNGGIYLNAGEREPLRHWRP